MSVPSIKQVAVHVRRVFTDGTEASFDATANSLEDALVAAQYLAGTLPNAAAAPKATKPTAAPAPASAAAAAEPEGNAQDSGSAATPKSSPAPAPTPEKSSDAQPSTELVYDKDIKPRVLRLAADQGADKTRATLQRFGVAKATELDQKQWPDFIAFIDKVLAKEVDPEASSEAALA